VRSDHLRPSGLCYPNHTIVVVTDSYDITNEETRSTMICQKLCSEGFVR